MTGEVAQQLVDLLLVALLSALAACAELVSRYRDAPLRAIGSPPGLLYAAINILVGLAAYAVILVFGWTFGTPVEATERVRLARIVVAGLGSAALFRTSLNFTVRQGTREWNVGPNAVRAALLRSVDSAIDRRRATHRLSATRPRPNDVDGISFSEDLFALTELCSHALQSLDRAEAQRLGAFLRELKARDELSERVRVEMYCLELRNWVGERALDAAINKLLGMRYASDLAARRAWPAPAGAGIPP
jgi:hypothetical protein